MRMTYFQLLGFGIILCIGAARCSKSSSDAEEVAPEAVASSAPLPSTATDSEDEDEGESPTAISSEFAQGLSLGTLAQGTERDVKISLTYSGSSPVTSLSIDGTSPELNYKGGSFPGVGGTCTRNILSSCDLILSFAAGLNLETIQSFVKLSYSTGIKRKNIQIPVTATTKFIYGTDSFTASDRIAMSVAGPIGVWTDGTKLIVLSTNQNRILIWNQFPSSNNTPPDLTLGSSSIGLAGPKYTDERTCHFPSDVDSNGTKIVVSCYGQNRVLIWNQWPTASFTAASVVVGQPDFYTKTPNTGGVSAATLYGVRGVALSGGRLYLADAFNNRVLIYDQIPSVNGQAADRIIGQSNATGVAWATTAEGMRLPIDMVIAGGRLFVSDYINHRVLAYASDYPATGESASFAIGQSVLTTGQANEGGSAAADTLNGPRGLTATADSLYIADSINNRVLRFSPIPSSSKPTAVQVLGQSDFVTSGEDGLNISARSLDDPGGVAVGGTKLVIGDVLNNRIVFHSAASVSNYPDAQFVWGQKTSSQDYNMGIRESATHCEHGFVTRNSNYFLLSCYYGNRVLVWDDMPKSPSDPAKLVIGQADFTSSLSNAGGSPAANTLSRPYRSQILDETLWVVDSGNNRILRYNVVPSANNASADIVVGQANLSGGSANRGGAADASTLSNPTGFNFSGSRILVADTDNNRVLIFNSIPSANGASANLVLGQSSMSDTAANRGGAAANNTLSGPVDVWTDGTRLAVVDGANNRVLLWNTFPTSNGQAADLVLGQSSFSGVLSNRGEPLPTRGGFDGANSLMFHNGNLFVLDRYNNRILVWEGWPSASGQLPDRVVFQSDFVSAGYGISDRAVADVNAMSLFDETIVVADRMNLRLLGLTLSEILSN